MPRSSSMAAFIPFVQVGDTPSLKMTTAMTFECWIYPTGHQSRSIIANREGEYEFARWDDETIRWAFANTNPGWTWITTGYVAPQKTWTHIAVTYDNGLITTYGNGVQVHQYQGSGLIGDVDPTLNDFRIGNRQAFPRHFPENRRIKDLRSCPLLIRGCGDLRRWLKRKL